MSPRISDKTIEFCIENPANFSHANLSMALDLKEARAHIGILDGFLASQAEIITTLKARAEAAEFTHVEMAHEVESLKARIAELEALSSSQEQAHALRDDRAIR